MARKKTSVALDEETTEFLADEPGSFSETIELLVQEEKSRRRQAELDDLVARKKMKQRDVFLLAVRDNYHEREAMRIAKVKQSQVDKWLEDEDFAAEFEACQLDYLEALERRLAMGRILNSAVVTGLIAFLNNNHPEWGFSRAKFISEIFEPLFDELLAIVGEEVSDKTYATINEKFQAKAEVRLARFG